MDGWLAWLIDRMIDCHAMRFPATPQAQPTTVICEYTPQTCLEEERVPEAHGLEEGGQLVVAVLAAADDPQKQVHLGGGEELQVVPFGKLTGRCCCEGGCCCGAGPGRQAAAGCWGGGEEEALGSRREEDGGRRQEAGRACHGAPLSVGWLVVLGMGWIESMGMLNRVMGGVETR